MKKRIVLLLFSFALGSIFCFAASLPSSHRLAKKDKIEFGIVAIDYAVIDIANQSDFDHAEAFRASLYLNQCKSLRHGYTVNYGSYSDASVYYKRYLFRLYTPLSV